MQAQPPKTKTFTDSVVVTVTVAVAVAVAAHTLIAANRRNADHQHATCNVQHATHSQASSLQRKRRRRISATSCHGTAHKQINT